MTSVQLSIADNTSILEKEMDKAAELSDRHPAHVFMPPVVNTLRSMCDIYLDRTDWNIITETCKSHPLFEICQEDPYTNRAYNKPRGYAGDAKLIDFFHGYNGPTNYTSPRGASLFSHSMTYAACDSVRYRRAYIASEIDRICKTKEGKARIASIACGHMREASFSQAIINEYYDYIILLDQDEKSLDLVNKEYATSNNIEVCHGKIQSMITGEYQLDSMDMIYASGLYDYLLQPMGKSLTKNLFYNLRENGILLLANFVPTIDARGYMHSFMDWRLVYRTQGEVVDLASDINREDIKSIRSFHDPHKCVVYLEIYRK